MKVLIILFTIVLLLVGLPLMHGFLTFLCIDKLIAKSVAVPLFYLFIIPTWALAVIVFVVETYRQSFIRSPQQINNILLLGLFGLFAPTAGLVLSPISTELSPIVLAIVAVLGLFVGLLGAVSFQLIVHWVRNF